MKMVSIKLTGGEVGDVTLDVARNMIGNGHAVRIADEPLFNPSAHNIDEVLAELERVAGNPVEVARIRQAELDGKNRQTLVSLWTEGQGSDEDSETA